MNARFYFGNLIADTLRCIKALEAGDENRYMQSLSRARKSLSYLRSAQRPEAYEEGLLLVYGLTLARASDRVNHFKTQLERLALSFTMV